jgi:sugar-specific transcriptional regulator TrmB
MFGAAGLESELGRLGLSADEARCYLGLLSRGPLTAREVTEVTGITRGRIYDVLKRLVTKGVVLETADPVRRFQAVDPTAGVANLLEEKTREARELEETAVKLVGALASMAGPDQGPVSFIEQIHHAATVQQRFYELEENVEREVLAFTKRPSIVVQNEREDAVLERGVEVRVVYETAFVDSAGEFDEILRLRSLGEQGRHLESLPTKLVVFDRSVTMLPLHEPQDGTTFTVLVIHHQGLSALAAAAFEHFWTLARPLPRTARTAAG